MRSFSRTFYLFLLLLYCRLSIFLILQRSFFSLSLRLQVLSGPVSFCRPMPLLRRNDSHKSRFVPFLGAFFRRRRSPSRSPGHFYQSQALKRAAVSFFGERSEMTRTLLNVKTKTFRERFLVQKVPIFYAIVDKFLKN
jgi:hypothetical protein